MSHNPAQKYFCVRILQLVFVRFHWWHKSLHVLQYVTANIEDLFSGTIVHSIEQIIGYIVTLRDTLRYLTYCIRKRLTLKSWFVPNFRQTCSQWWRESETSKQSCCPASFAISSISLRVSINWDELGATSGSYGKQIVMSTIHILECHQHFNYLRKWSEWRECISRRWCKSKVVRCAKHKQQQKKSTDGFQTFCVGCYGLRHARHGKQIECSSGC